MSFPGRNFLSSILILVCLLSGCRDSESSAGISTGEAGGRIVKVSVVPVQPETLRDVLVLPGESEASQDVMVSAETGGRVEWIGPDEGEAVSEGQLLAKIEVSVLKAVLDRTEAAFKLADALYQRRLRLSERKIINQEALDHSLTERVVAEGNLRQARMEYERGLVRSPISGVVNRLFVDEGEFIKRGSPVADLVNVDKIEINVNVPELDVRYIQPGQKVQVTIDAFAGQDRPGIVDFVAYKADTGTKTFMVRVMIDNEKHLVRPGMIARVAFVRRVIPEALVVPLFALVDKGGERLVFIEKDGVAHARTVAIGIIEGSRVQITKGIEPGDHLVVTGQTEVEEGMKVQVQ